MRKKCRGEFILTSVIPTKVGTQTFGLHAGRKLWIPVSLRWDDGIRGQGKNSFKRYYLIGLSLKASMVLIGSSSTSSTSTSASSG